MSETDKHQHLAGATIACVLALVVAASWIGYARWLERRALGAVAPLLFQSKNQGEVLARAAWQDPQMLPVYGGSELQKETWGMAPVFFEKAPTGFAVFAIGKEGTMPLNMVHRIAAMGEAVRGKKVVVILSPTWFLRPTAHPRFYEGNFSLLQAQEFAFSGYLDFALKQDGARHMLEYPATLKDRPLLEFALKRLAGGTAADRMLYACAIPLARVEDAVLRAQDHFETVGEIHSLVGTPGQWHPHVHPLDWPALFAEAMRKTYTWADNDPRPEKVFQDIERRKDAAFSELAASAHEWEHLDLLLRTLSQLGARPLLLSPPLNGPYLDRIGVSAQAREDFYKRLRGMADHYGFELMDFQDREWDSQFLVDRHDHPSVEGWMYYNSAIDGFFHGGSLEWQPSDTRPKKLRASPAP